ncbi:hypothetical protein [Streptomyces sp. NPDC003483]
MIEHQGPWRDAYQVERAVVQWVGWYNTERLRAALGYIHSRPGITDHGHPSAPPETRESGRYETRGSSSSWAGCLRFPRDAECVDRGSDGSHERNIDHGCAQKVLAGVA